MFVAFVPTPASISTIQHQKIVENISATGFSAPTQPHRHLHTIQPVAPVQTDIKPTSPTPSTATAAPMNNFAFEASTMKDVIDVMELQREKHRSRLQPMDYRKMEFAGGFTPARFVFECGIKLRGQPLTIATATILMHRFFREVDPTNYDCYLIAASTLYLAGKIKDDPLKIRDIINVSHSTLHRNNSPLEIGDEYWNMRDAIVQAELLIMRVLKFEVTITHPHKYMLHYLRSLEGLLGKDMWNKTPIARTSAAFLQDFHHDAGILDFEPKHVAIACISLSLQCYGVQLPLLEDSDDEAWYSVFVKDLQKEKHWEIMEKIMEVYSKDLDL